jgi:hypothetical protein
MAHFVEAFRYKPEGRGFDSLGFFVDLNLFPRNVALGSTQPLTEMSTGSIFLG